MKKCFKKSNNNYKPAPAPAPINKLRLPHTMTNRNIKWVEDDNVKVKSDKNKDGLSIYKPIKRDDGVILIPTNADNRANMAKLNEMILG